MHNLVTIRHIRLLAGTTERLGGQMTDSQHPPLQSDTVHRRGVKRVNNIKTSTQSQLVLKRQ